MHWHPFSVLGNCCTCVDWQAWRRCTGYSCVQVRRLFTPHQALRGVPPLASAMAMTAAATVLEHDDLPPDGEPSFADVVYLLTTPPPDADPKNPWDLGSRVCSYVTLFAYSLAHPKQFALWANDAYRIGETIEDATYPEVRRDFVLAAKAKLEYAFSVTKLFLFAPRGPEARARAMAMRPLPVRSPPEDG